MSTPDFKKNCCFGSWFYLLLQVNFGVPNFKENELFSVRTNITIYVPPHNVLEEGSRNAFRNVFNVKYIKVKVKV
jgi:hypothetical protein